MALFEAVAYLVNDNPCARVFTHVIGSVYRVLGGILIWLISAHLAV